MGRLGIQRIPRGYEPNATLGEFSELSTSRSLPRRREDLIIPLMPTDESRAPPAGCTRNRGALIDEHYHLIPRDTDPVTMKSLAQSRCGELSRGGPVRQSCAFTGVSRPLGKAADIAWGGMGQDHTRVMSSAEQ